MATVLTPPPWTSPLLVNGVVTQPWLTWFQAVYENAGGGPTPGPTPSSATDTAWAVLNNADEAALQDAAAMAGALGFLTSSQGEATAAGNDTEVQVNQSGALGASSNFRFADAGAESTVYVQEVQLKSTAQSSGGGFQIRGRDGTLSQPADTIVLRSGENTSLNSQGAIVQVTGGTSNGGSVLVRSGNTTTGNAGTIQFDIGALQALTITSTGVLSQQGVTYKVDSQGLTVTGRPGNGFSTEGDDIDVIAGLTVATATQGYIELQTATAYSTASLVLTGDGTSTYSADITVDGAAPVTVSFTGDGTTDTVQDLLTSLTAQLTGVAVVSLVSGRVRISSPTFGGSSSVTYVDDGTFPLFGDMEIATEAVTAAVVPGYAEGPTAAGAVTLRGGTFDAATDYDGASLVLEGASTDGSTPVDGNALLTARNAITSAFTTAFSSGNVLDLLRVGDLQGEYAGAVALWSAPGEFFRINSGIPWVSNPGAPGNGLTLTAEQGDTGFSGGSVTLASGEGDAGSGAATPSTLVMTGGAPQNGGGMVITSGTGRDFTGSSIDPFGGEVTITGGHGAFFGDGTATSVNGGTFSFTAGDANQSTTDDTVAAYGGGMTVRAGQATGNPSLVPNANIQGGTFDMLGGPASVANLRGTATGLIAGGGLINAGGVEGGGIVLTGGSAQDNASGHFASGGQVLVSAAFHNPGTGEFNGSNTTISAGSAQETALTAGAELELTGGQFNGTDGTGGGARLTAGDGNGAGGAGGAVTISAGAGTANSGNVILEANSTDDDPANGGNILLRTGDTLTTRITVAADGALGLGPTPDYGTAGDVLTSQGAGAPPIWAPGGSGAAGLSTEKIIAAAAQTVFNTTVSTIAESAGVAHLQVYVNGQLMDEDATTDYTVTGANQITFNYGLALNDLVRFYNLG